MRAAPSHSHSTIIRKLTIGALLLVFLHRRKLIAQPVPRVQIDPTAFTIVFKPMCPIISCKTTKTAVAGAISVRSSAPALRSQVS